MDSKEKSSGNLGLRLCTVYALVFVCLLTGATNILATETLETQDIVQAIERQASRYGVPADVYVDNSTYTTETSTTCKVEP